ncbi:MAG TPA: S41 family peptidase [Phototrophicaceae bacterium]|nr:S41 family peptidase [Phototrophicaceae bacterium]
MRSRILFLLIVLVFVIGIGAVSAQDTTPEATPVTTAEATEATTATEAVTATQAAEMTEAATTAATEAATAAATAQPTQAPVVVTEAANPQASIPAATIVNDQGGPVTVEGHLTYTNQLFTSGVSEPEIILEDEAGFVDRNHHFVIPIKSQVIGQITSDFYTSPVSYTLSLPEVPNGDYRDVNHDGKTDKGVQVFAVAYWENLWGDPYLEERDQYGGGWSTAYTSAAIDQNPSANGEVTGGEYIVYAPDDQQDFPSDFGADGKLFTADDPLVRLPQGYTVVNMDTHPFTFDRSKDAHVELLEGSEAAGEDFSNQSYTDAFKSLIELMRKEYAFTDFKHIDWDAEEAKFLPEFQKADADHDKTEYYIAVRDFSWSIPDGHVESSAVDELNDQFDHDTAGGLGMAITELDNGNVIVDYLTKGGPAEQAGIQLKAQITQINGQPIEDAIKSVVPWSSPFSSSIFLKLQQLRYITRSPLGTQVAVSYRNPGDTADKTVTLTSVQESDSFSFSSMNKGGPLGGVDLPVEYTLLDSGYIEVSIYSFFDNNRLNIEIWERLMQTLNQYQIPGLIIDMRHNGGGNGWVADQMAAYFFEQPLDLGNSTTYDKTKGQFYTDPNGEEHFILPDQQFRYDGPVAVLVQPTCESACEFFTWDMTQQNRAAIVGQYPTGGLGGSIEAINLPENVYFQFPIARNIDAQGNLKIEGTGVVPTVKVPVDETTVFSTGDPVLDAAVNWLDQQQKSSASSSS